MANETGVEGGQDQFFHSLIDQLAGGRGAGTLSIDQLRNPSLAQRIGYMIDGYRNLSRIVLMNIIVDEDTTDAERIAAGIVLNKIQEGVATDAASVVTGDAGVVDQAATEKS